MLVRVLLIALGAWTAASAAEIRPKIYLYPEVCMQMACWLATSCMLMALGC